MNIRQRAARDKLHPVYSRDIKEADAAIMGGLSPKTNEWGDTIIRPGLTIRRFTEAPRKNYRPHMKYRV